MFRSQKVKGRRNLKIKQLTAVMIEFLTNSKPGVFSLQSRIVKAKLIARLVLRQKGKIYWPIFQLAELVFFRASTMRN